MPIAGLERERRMGSDLLGSDLNDPPLDQPSHGFAYRFDGPIARTIAEHPLRLGDRAIGAVCNVIVGLRRLQFALCILPFRQSEDNRQFPGGLTLTPIGRLVGWRREAPGAA